MNNLKRGLVVAGGLVVSLSLIACSDNDTPVKADDGKFSGGSGYIQHEIVTDNETGCQYIQGNKAKASYITPRLDENGKPMCNGNKEDK